MAMPPLNTADPSVVVPSRNFTLPVGVGPVLVTVAVGFYGWAKSFKRHADLLIALVGGVLKTNFAGFGGSLNENLPGECPAEF